jgi:hypothetical protein
MMRFRTGWWVLIAAALLLGGDAPLRPCVANDHEPSPEGGRADRLRVADSAQLEVIAHWGPITESEFSFHQRWDELKNLRPAKERVTYSGTDFQALLPTKPVAPGELWELSDEGLLTFLRQLHPGTRLKLHINNGDSRGGGLGCVRAIDDRWADVIFRAHAEFALNDGVYTPGQFAGRLAIERSTGRVAYFRLHLPHSPVNVDIGWRWAPEVKVGDRMVKGELHWIADAGSVSRLELVGGDKGILRALDGVPGKTIEEVHTIFARYLYRFKAIEWVEFGQALAVARRTGKPLHVIALNGTLDDESC